MLKTAAGISAAEWQLSWQVLAICKSCTARLLSKWRRLDHPTQNPPHTPHYPQHAFKLVVMRADGCCYWEDGPDRELEVPEGAAAVAAASRTGIRVACRFGDASDTDVSLASAAALDAAAPKVLAAELASYAVEASPVAASQRPGANGALAQPGTMARAARLLEPSSERASPAELNLQLA